MFWILFCCLLQAVKGKYSLLKIRSLSWKEQFRNLTLVMKIVMAKFPSKGTFVNFSIRFIETK